jgi:hypothetical protein
MRLLDEQYAAVKKRQGDVLISPLYHVQTKAAYPQNGYLYFI